MRVGGSLVAPGLGRLKPDITGSSHSGRLASDFSTFPLVNLRSFLGAKAQSDAHYSSKNNIFPIQRTYTNFP